MSRELGEYLNDLVAERGEPQDWQTATRMVADACLTVEPERQRMYGHGNIAKFGLHGIVIRATDKLERLSTMVFGNKSNAAESIEDTCGDLANYGLYGVMTKRGWWELPLVEYIEMPPLQEPPDDTPERLPSFYLAAPFCECLRMADIARQLRERGLTVTSRWHDDESQVQDDDDTERWAEFAAMDLEDIDAADILVVFTRSPAEALRRGSRHVEAGYAIGKGKQVYVVGPVENIFYATVEPRNVFPTAWTFIGEMKRRFLSAETP